MKQSKLGVFNLLTRLFCAAFIVSSALLLTSCGGGGGGDGADSNPDSLQQGVFIDSPVEGLDYNTPSRQGVTDSNGRFSYREGEQVTFLLGDLELGQTDGQAIITPLDLVAGAGGARDQAVTNICRLLQSLDVDGNPDNGIVLPDAVATAVAGRTIDFAVTPEDFSNDSHILGLLADLNTQEVFSGGVRTLVSAEQARNHLLATLGQGGNNDDPPGTTAESSFESNLRGLINDYRSQSGLGNLAFDPQLYQLAQQHSTDMQAVDKLSHDGFQDRYHSSGYRGCVENVAWNYQTPEHLLAGWQNSPGHDQNLLNSNIDFVGLSKVGAYSTFFACGN